MRKTTDWFYAGMVAGAVGGVLHILYNVVLLLAGVKAAPFWKALGGLFYNKQLLATWPAQLHSMIDVIGVSAGNGVLTSFVLELTGTDCLYAKSVALSSAGAAFLFLVVYPLTGLGRNSPTVPWVAFFGHNIFNGLVVGFILAKICAFGKEPIIACAQAEPREQAASDDVWLGPLRQLSAELSAVAGKVELLGQRLAETTARLDSEPKPESDGWDRVSHLGFKVVKPSPPEDDPGNP